ncbi:MAG: Alpha/beta hydrolase family [Verrucomicrobiales bacterium]|nr:Alpha/beta hydrolase family [Verrucomicrobiales bacterium]
MLLVAAPAPAAPSEQGIVLREGLGIGTGGSRARTAFHTDPIEALIVSGKWSRPQAGDTLSSADGTNRVWETVTAREDGSFTNSLLRGGYVYLPFVSNSEQTFILEAQGHTMVYVNGEPRTGDPYSNGSVALPVRLNRGTNEFLFAAGRGALHVKLIPPAKPLSIDLRDTTAPDLVIGQKNEMPAAVIVVNSTTNFVRDLVLTVSSRGGKTTTTVISSLLPLSTRKVGFSLNHSGKSDSNRVEFALTLIMKNSRREEPLDSATLNLRLRAADEKRKETFVSNIDGSVQYFGITPARPLTRNHPPLALVLTVHGAGVEGQGQADAYAPKTWAHIVAPTNRRPYGFDWEDWGRRDAVEVLDIAMKKYGTDPRQTYLTGHSMGGHGTWQIGATLPDRFAAIAPSAGWISFFSYAGGRRYEGTNALHKLIQRAANSSDTLAMASNYLHHGIYILHGDADDNVPVSEARKMREVLGKFHHAFDYHEQPGAGHWWGNGCVDWPPIFDLFSHHKIPTDESLTAIHFTTLNPGASSSSHWIAIEAQQHDLDPSTVDAHYEPNAPSFKVITENVVRMTLDLTHLNQSRPPVVELDGQKISVITTNVISKKVWFTRNGETWIQSQPPSLTMKGPHRYGPFKEAFYHKMLFVYGTKGSPEETAWAFSKARFDAEAFWYRGNGSIDVIPDSEFDPTKEKDRSVILYGNADTLTSWNALLADSPVQVRRGQIRVGQREFHGDNLATLFLRPRPGSDIASVGIVAGTGLSGFKLTDRIPYFSAGVAYPDCTVFNTEVLAKGTDAVLAAGFFGPDWSIEKGEFLFKVHND